MSTVEDSHDKRLVGYIMGNRSSISANNHDSRLHSTITKSQALSIFTILLLEF